MWTLPKIYSLWYCGVLFFFYLGCRLKVCKLMCLSTLVDFRMKTENFILLAQYSSWWTTSVRETRSWGGLPLKRGTVSLKRVLFTLHHNYRKKNQNFKKRQWCLWRFMCPLSMHQFIEISICALEKKKFKYFDVERPVKVCVLTGQSREPPPKL